MTAPSDDTPFFASSASAIHIAPPIHQPIVLIYLILLRLSQAPLFVLQIEHIPEPGANDVPSPTILQLIMPAIMKCQETIGVKVLLQRYATPVSIAILGLPANIDKIDVGVGNFFFPPIIYSLPGDVNKQN